MMHATENGRLFILLATPVNSLLNQIALYDFDYDTGEYSYVGRIQFAISSVAPTARGFKVDDSNTSNIKIFLGITSTTATVGGLLMINKVDISDFVPIGFPIFYTAQSNDSEGVYHLDAPGEAGGSNLMVTLSGLTIPGPSSANANINTKAYVHNGVSATHQFYVFDYSTGPVIEGLGTSTVTANNTTGANTTFTMAGNTLKVNDAVIITSNAPTGYTNSAVNAAQTVYFVVATNFVNGSTFSLSATLGGAIVAASTAVGTTTFVRAHGASTNNFVAKTANLSALVGTLLLTNSENYCVPSSGANSGQDCVFFSTSSQFYLARLTELYSTQTGTLTSGANTVTGLSSTASLNIGQTISGTGIQPGTVISTIAGPTSITMSLNATASGAQTLNFGVTLWPSLQTVNVIGTGIDFVAPVPIFAAFLSSINSVAYTNTGPITLIKQFVNSQITSVHGGTGNYYMEAQNHVTDKLQIQAITNFENSNGWLFYSSSATVGQRGIIVMDIRSDCFYDYSMIISPVVATKGLQTLNFVETLEQLYDFTGGSMIEYRTAPTLSDAIFNTASGGWTEVPYGQDFNTPLDDFTQFRIKFVLTTDPSGGADDVTTPAQIVDLKYTTSLLAEISDNWDYSFNDSSSAIPTRIGFHLRSTYASVVPKIYFRAYDVAGNLLTTADTVANAGNFQYSTDGGNNWLSLGTIPNTVGTRIRYTFTTPPGVDIRVSLKES